MSENKYLKILFCAFLFALAVYGWRCIGIGRDSVHYNGSGAAGVADRIESAKELNNKADSERQKAQAGIAAAEKSAERIEAGLEQSADNINQLAASIDRCQQTLDRIRNRGKIETSTN